MFEAAIAMPARLAAMRPVVVRPVRELQSLVLILRDGAHFPNAMIALRQAGFTGKVRVMAPGEWVTVIAGKCDGYLPLPWTDAGPAAYRKALLRELWRQRTWAEGLVWVLPGRNELRFLQMLRRWRMVFSFHDGALAALDPARRLSAPGIQHVGGQERELAVRYLKPALVRRRRGGGRLRLGVDGDGVIWRREATGIQWARRGLLAALSEDELDVDLSVFTVSDEARSAWELPWTRNLCTLPRALQSLDPFDRARAVPARALSGPLDLFHLTFYDPLPLRFERAVATCYDMMPVAIPEAYPDHIKRQFEWTVPFWQQECARVIVNSEFTRGDLERYAGIPRERSVCIPIARHPHYTPRPSAEVQAVLRRYGIGGPYFLALGSLVPHKNILALCRAFIQVRARYRLPHRLVLVGRPAWDTPALLEEVRKAGGYEAITFTGYADYTDVPALYTGATAFCQPSLFEGYGMPVQEAMCCGCPVLLSNTTSLPEVAGDAGVYWNPRDVEDMARVLAEFAQDEGLRERKRGEALRRARQFLSWREVALAHRAVYESVLAQ